MDPRRLTHFVTTKRQKKPNSAFRSEPLGSLHEREVRLLPSRRSLRVRVFGVRLVGFMMANRTSRRSAKPAVASHVAGEAADDDALDTFPRPPQEIKRRVPAGKPMRR
jgi:hypothetical protein